VAAAVCHNHAADEHYAAQSSKPASSGVDQLRYACQAILVPAPLPGATLHLALLMLLFAVLLLFPPLTRC
jgi:hypothetical protein